MSVSLREQGISAPDKATSGIRIARNLDFSPDDLFGDGVYEDVPRPETLRSEQIADVLKNRVYGQDHACDAVAQSVVNAESGFHDGRRPRGSMLFLGPTGVGKTELAKALAGVLYPEDPDIRTVVVDCTGLQEASSVTRLKGSDPKYVGYGSNVLIMPEQIENGAVVVFDEVEKGNPQVWQWLMPILENGAATLFLPSDEPDPNGSTGKKIVPVPLRFNNTFIIMTSNEGAEQMQEARRQGAKAPLGFRTRHTEPSKLDHTETAMQALRTGRFKAFPEFLGRIDQTVVFNELGGDHYHRIFDKFLSQAQQAHMQNDPGSYVTIMAAPEVRSWVIDHADTVTYGGRNIRTTLHETLLRQVADYKASGAFRPHAFVYAYLDGDEIRFRQRGFYAASENKESHNTAIPVYERPEQVTEVAPKYSPV